MGDQRPARRPDGTGVKTLRDHPAVLAPPPVIVLGFVLIGWALSRGLPPVLMWGRPVRLTGAALVAAGVVVSGWCLLEFVRHRTHPDPYHPTKRIIRRGPYTLSRNPIYVAFVLIHLGFGLWRVNFWIAATTVLTAYVLHRWVVLPEERYLADKFGEEYEEYRRRVRRWV